MSRTTSAIAFAAAGLLLAAGTSVAPAATSDPFWDQQWGAHQVRAASAWQASRGAGVTIAVVDTGVDLDHPDLAPKLVIVPGSDVADGDSHPDDDSEATDSSGNRVRGHGTMVAGVAAAVTGNAEGIAAVAPDARIMPLKVFPSQPRQGLAGAFDATNVPRAIRLAADHGAQVINLSLTTLFGNTGLVGTIESPCREAFDRGSLCVVAAGNSGQDRSSGYPQGFDAVVVTGNRADGHHVGSAQRPGTKWGLSAPGEGIVSTYLVDGGGYAAATGTSVAAPHVAGAAALLFAQGLGPRQVAERLVATAQPAPDEAFAGSGILDAAAAVGAPVVPGLDGPGGPPAPGPAPTPAAPAPGAGGSGSPSGPPPAPATTTTTTVPQASPTTAPGASDGGDGLGLAGGDGGEASGEGDRTGAGAGDQGGSDVPAGLAVAAALLAAAALGATALVRARGR